MAFEPRDPTLDSGLRDGRWKQILDLASTIGILVVCASLIWIIATGRVPASSSTLTAESSMPLPADPISIADSEHEGSTTARVALIEYSDFECPYCAVFANEVLPAIERNYVNQGTVLFAFRHLPLERRHASAFGAAEAAECAGRQGKFWPMHHVLFQDQAHLDRPTILARAAELNLDSSKFQDCLQGQAKDKIKHDQLTAASLSVSGTPTYFVGLITADGSVRVTARLAGARPIAEFEHALDKALGSVPKR